MAQVKISNLPPAASSLLTDEFAANQGGITKKITAQQILNLLPQQGEVWFSVDESTNNFSYRVRNVSGSGNQRFTFSIPSNFSTLTSLELIGSPNSAGASGSGKDVDLFSDYAQIGESNQTHSESDTITTYNFGSNADDFFSMDISPVFTMITANDICGLEMDQNSVGGSVSYYGIKLKYIII